MQDPAEVVKITCARFCISYPGLAPIDIGGLTHYRTVVSLVVSCFSQCDVLMNLHWGCGIKMTNTLGLFLLGLRPMELVSHWLCQFWQSLPVSAESAGFGRFCRFRQILPISADTADFGRYCRLYVGINKVSTWYSRFRPTLPISADSADFGRICRFWLTLPILADSVDFG